MRKVLRQMEYSEENKPKISNYEMLIFDLIKNMDHKNLKVSYDFEITLKKTRYLS